jgi:hypothetical protein
LKVEEIEGRRGKKRKERIRMKEDKKNKVHTSCSGNISHIF